MGSLHCLNVGCADASVIKSDGHTFLIDCHGIDEHASHLPASKTIRGVFVTHQHRDHYSGLKYLWNKGYKIDYLIYSPYDRRYGDTSVTLDEWREFNNFKDKFVSRGTKTYTPYRQSSWNQPFWNASKNVKFWVLGPESNLATASTRELHDASLVVTGSLGKRKCVFTGDASDKNLKYIAANTEGFCSDILHASHHASINGADLSFIKKCNAHYTVISTKTGVHQNLPHPTAIRRYNDNTADVVYRTDIDGTIYWVF